MQTLPSDARELIASRYDAGRRARGRAEGEPLEAIEHVWSWNRLRRHLTPSQAAVADVKRDRMTKVYAPVREAAKARQVSGLKRGDKKPVPAQIPERGPRAERETRSVRAKAAGANRPVNLLVLYPGDPDPTPEVEAQHAGTFRVVFVHPEPEGAA